MPMKLKLIAILAAGSIFALDAGAQKDDAWRSQISKEEFKFNVTLSSGTIVKNVIYKHSGLNDNFYLILRRKLGMEIESYYGSKLESIDHDEFIELMGVVIEKIKIDHSGVLDEMYIDSGFVDDFWLHLIEKMREAPIPPSTLVEAKSRTLTRQLSIHMRESDLFRDICSFAASIDKHCSISRYQIEGIAFILESHRMPWGDVKNFPNAGIDKEEMWFSITYR